MMYFRLAISRDDLRSFPRSTYFKRSISSGAVKLTG